MQALIHPDWESSEVLTTNFAAEGAKPIRTNL
jgi:hypothetical protein